MTILALDTASDQASVALRKDGRTVAEDAIVTTDGHSQLLFPMLEQLLRSAGLAVRDVDCFASARGPGSFTGVRLCLTAAKGLGHATGKPVAGVSNLRALASLGTARLRNPILDARRGQIYTALYDDGLTLVSDEVVVAEQDWHAPAEAERIVSGRPLAAAVAWCAEQDGPGCWVDAALLDARYVRRSDAQSFWEDLKSGLK